MYKKFVISEISAVEYDKRIIIRFNYEVNRETVTPDSISITTQEKEYLDFTCSVDKEVIVVTLKEWPRINTIHQVIVDGTIENIVGDKLETSLRRKVMFKSEINSRPEIVSPYNFEKLQELSFEFKDEDNISVYYVEIADNIRFYDCFLKETIYAAQYVPVVPDLKAGQYYIRIRCQKGNKFGPWSRPVTFIYKDVCVEDYPEDPGPSANVEMPSAWDDMYTSRPDPVIDTEGNLRPETAVIPDVEIEDILEIMTTPENGTTPKAFIFEFDKELDTDFGDVVIIKREF